MELVMMNVQKFCKIIAVFAEISQKNHFRDATKMVF